MQRDIVAEKEAISAQGSEHSDQRWGAAARLIGFSAPGDLLRTHWPVTVASFRTWRGWRDCVAQDPAHV